MLREPTSEFQVNDLKEEGVVSGDHGYDPIAIASGESSGNIVNAGPSKNKRKRKVKRSTIKEAIVQFKRD